MMSYRSSSSFVPLRWFLRKLLPLDFEIFAEITVFRIFFKTLSDIELIFGMQV